MGGSSESKGFHKFSRKYLPFLLMKCPADNLHFIWESYCWCADNGQGKFCFNYLTMKWVNCND